MYHTEEQKQLAEKSKETEQMGYMDEIVTEIVPLPKFWRAEEYHQNYFANNPENRFCKLVVKKKVDKVKQLSTFQDVGNKSPLLT